MIPIDQVIGLALVLMALGMIGVIRRRNLVVVLFSIQLMVSSALLVLVGFNRMWAGRAIAAGDVASVDGQAFALLVLSAGVLQLMIGIGLVLVVVRRNQSANIDDINLLRG